MVRSRHAVPWPGWGYTMGWGRRQRALEAQPWRSTLAGALLACLLTGLTLVGPAVQAQGPEAPSAPAEAVAHQTLLVEIVRSIEQLERDLQDKQAELRSPQAEGRKEELQQQIQALSIRLDTLRRNFSEIAAGVDLKVFAQQDESFDWQKSLLAFLRPVLSELTRLTARPREIEHLRTQIAHYKTQQQVAEQALENLRRLTGQSQEAPLAPHLQRLQREWQQRYQEISTQVSVATQQLKQVIGEERSLGESVHGLLEIFFRSRTRNFLLACLTFGLVWLILYRLRHAVQRLILRRRTHLTFAMRLLTVAGTIFTVVGATCGFLLALYILEDWVLLTLAVLVLLGVAWTSQSTLPRFTHEMMLLLNLGAVREGERVVYKGVPWLVQSLNFYTRLVNPELLGGDIRLPLRDFADLRSRPFAPDQPWFPTHVDDWVLLNGETLAKGILQTPDVVRLVFLGGSRRTLRTPDFLAQSPVSLATGFRLDLDFDLDYQHQAAITREIPSTLRAALHQAIQRDGYAAHLVNPAVEFAEAGASALHVRVLADFAGAAAPSSACAWRPVTPMTGSFPSRSSRCTWPHRSGMARRRHSTAPWPAPLAGISAKPEPGFTGATRPESSARRPGAPKFRAPGPCASSPRTGSPRAP